MKKLITLLTALFLSFSSIFALPGFPPYIQELPGQYVYYEDKTFQRKSYFGLLQFDEKTFAARYYAPFDTKEKKPETDVEIYFTIDPKADHMELTGEKIMSGFTPEEAEIINYLHDMIYELSARRKKIGALSENKRIVRNDEHFGQFGGFVTVEYDAIVPLFNLKQVFSDESAPELFIVTAGQLTSATDKSFEKFKGFPEKLQDVTHTTQKNKKITPVTFKTESGKNVLLDSSWTQSMDNVFMQGDSALISVNSIPYAPVDFLIRQLLLSTGDSYLNWKKTEITESENKVTISGIYFQPSTKNVSKNYKIAEKKQSQYDFFTLTIYDSVFEKNRKYYLNLLKVNTENN